MAEKHQTNTTGNTPPPWPMAKPKWIGGINIFTEFLILLNF